VRALAVLAVALVLAACARVPVPSSDDAPAPRPSAGSPVPDGGPGSFYLAEPPYMKIEATADVACTRLRALGCGEGWPTMDLEFQAGCPSNVERSGIGNCIVQAHSVADVRACKLPCVGGLR
jgi:hypothetical protein